MITQDSIDSLKGQIEIDRLIGEFVTLKKKGSVYMGLCPFHDEKTPSFTVSPAKGIYKCFGCGASGDGIGFVMQHEHLNFIDAIRKIAQLQNFQLEEKEETIDKENRRKKKYSMAAINAAAQRHWSNLLLSQEGKEKTAYQYLTDRGINKDSIVQWQLGFAPDEWRFLTPKIIDSNCWNEAEELGLVKNKNEQNFDLWRNRIMFPVHDLNGLVVAFGGRTMMDKEEIKSANTPKYINSRNVDGFFNKSRTLYGLFYAQRHIREMGFALLVEGYTDVISMHQAGALNTVATLGTALVEHHAKLLRKYTNRVVIFRDGDAAGLKAMMSDTDTLLAEGFIVDAITLPAKEDPDTWAKQFMETEQEELSM